MKYSKYCVVSLLTVLIAYGCSKTGHHEASDRQIEKEQSSQSTTSPFWSDVEFLRNYLKIAVLESDNGLVAVAPDLQGRVMTSATKGDNGNSYGWINRNHFQSGDTSLQINVYGGEERFWLGPEGGQYSIFFKEGAEFTFENWSTPRLIDLEPFLETSKTLDNISFVKKAQLVNYSGFTFDFEIKRDISILDRPQIEELLNVELTDQVELVGYRTNNQLTNTGTDSWTKEGGLLSIWLLGMFKPSPEVTVVIPITTGNDSELGPKVVDDYFGKVPASRLVATDKAIYFKGDGQQRGKIGIKPQRATEVMGSYDAQSGVLTVVKFSKPDDIDDYVNSKWEHQSEPYAGDVINSYNDGPVDGGDPLGPFYELESSSPALSLAPGETGNHVQSTIHFEGGEDHLDGIARQVLGVTIEEIVSAFSDE